LTYARSIGSLNSVKLPQTHRPAAIFHASLIKMSGTVKHAKIETRTSRARLPGKREPYWRALIVGRAHLGWQRNSAWSGRFDAGDHRRLEGADGDGSNYGLRNRDLPAAGKSPGRWILRRYVDGKYKHHQLGLADDLAEADGRLILSFEQAQAAALAMLDAPAALLGRLTVAAAMDAYTDHLRDQGKAVDDLIWRTRAHILPRLANVPVADLTTEQLSRWRAMLAAMPAQKRTGQGAKQQYKAEPVTDEDLRKRRASAQRVFVMLRASLNLAFRHGKVGSDAAWRRVEPFKGVDAARVRFLTVSEAQRLLNACEPSFRLLVRAGLETGCRYSELTRLEVGDYHPDSGSIHVRQSKSGKSRHVVLTEDQGQPFFAEVCAGRLGNEIMFMRASLTGLTKWTPATQARPMREACQRAGIDPPITFHGLRHTWASLSVMAGVPLVVIAKQLGHANTRMIEAHYGHLTADYVVDAIRAGAPRFGKVERKVVALG
jgi:integrase